jgi:hypothetical protein
MTPRPRLRLTLPPLSPREALTLSAILDTIDDLLWIHYGDEMVALLTGDTFVPETWRSARRVQGQ